MRTVVYADGGCDPNPGSGGWGVVISGPKRVQELFGGERDTTNNRMELTAAIRALEHFPEGAQIEMRCDSQYVIKSMTEWMRGWKAKGWRTTTGEVKNVDLMKRLDELASRRDVHWTWVRGHAGDSLNERADRLAARGRRQALGLSMQSAPIPASVSPMSIKASSKPADAPPPAGAGSGGMGSPDAPGGAAKAPSDWAGIGIGSIVLACQGPMEGWWEAVVLYTKADDRFVLRWRDFPDDGEITRARKDLGLMSSGSREGLG